MLNVRMFCTALRTVSRTVTFVTSWFAGPPVEAWSTVEVPAEPASITWPTSEPARAAMLQVLPCFCLRYCLQRCGFRVMPYECSFGGQGHHQQQKYVSLSSAGIHLLRYLLVCILRLRFQGLGRPKVGGRSRRALHRHVVTSRHHRECR